MGGCWTGGPGCGCPWGPGRLWRCTGWQVPLPRLVVTTSKFTASSRRKSRTGSLNEPLFFGAASTLFTTSALVSCLTSPFSLGPTLRLDQSIVHGSRGHQHSARPCQNDGSSDDTLLTVGWKPCLLPWQPLAGSPEVVAQASCQRAVSLPVRPHWTNLHVCSAL